LTSPTLKQRRDSVHDPVLGERWPDLEGQGSIDVGCSRFGEHVPHFAGWKLYDLRVRAGLTRQELADKVRSLTEHRVTWRHIETWESEAAKRAVHLPRS
jgi:hypothetical protein